MAGLQDAFLAECRRLGAPVTVFLVNGFQLRGVVKGFDPFTLLLEYERKTHLIYKHAISTISPGAAVAVASTDGVAAVAAEDEGG
ncbi:MAG TPA: RNA chaperone Hfq [Candidatus Acidoferrales bacterium]|jgi:host factor-I protein|nr:RNA chaperone Hfq [Candidatus Acidoferrales bacterium]